MFEITSHAHSIVTTDRQVSAMHAVADRGREPHPAYFWYVEGEGMNVLVDTGGPAIETVREELGGMEYVPEQPFEGGEASVRSALDEHGVEPSDIDVIICTHLHSDHNWNIDLFPDATAYVQRDELIHALDPTPHQRFGYAREATLKVAERKQPDQLRIMDGDYHIADGIEVYKTPGHTPGHQCAMIRTDRGKVGLYLSKLYQNWFPADPDFGTPMSYLDDTYCVEGILTESARDYQRTMERMADICDIIVPAHDPYIPRSIPEEWYFSDLDATYPSEAEKETYKRVKKQVNERIDALGDFDKKDLFVVSD